MEQDFLEQTKGREIDLIVCSDAEQILGIGDQGVGVSARVYLSYRGLTHILRVSGCVRRATTMNVC